MLNGFERERKAGACDYCLSKTGRLLLSYDYGVQAVARVQTAMFEGHLAGMKVNVGFSGQVAISPGRKPLEGSVDGKESRSTDGC